MSGAPETPANGTRGAVLSVGYSKVHGFTKPPCPEIRLIAGHGVEGDAHCGSTVKHRSRVAKDPAKPNLRQAHLIHAELFEELAQAGFSVGPGDLGENITTRGLNLLALPRGTLLHLGAEAIVEVTGLRNPCQQINDFQPGLMQAVLERTPAGALLRKTGVMGVVRAGGLVRRNDIVRVELPAGSPIPLEPV
ncbi:MAG: MOSC domain-containing protein [Beijerinckiaceae bacterium]